ncbi:NADH dehydrogenase [ubiquinone] iron-sulfur protein 6, mitochondrial [Hypanus sabinus]|uniref:NADH dehydrogenase [ubiquinone] iron-sulfur protein 6, mitochondrial n=1 Tax=Hypanus sabinus TaxID=79690 RepID=UPI0028C449AC|nr:NADH dehydrogenase [ubiquinone] iron-sulfur protein 6, mitochondrial [Hypanus sabinus]
MLHAHGVCVSAQNVLGEPERRVRAVGPGGAQVAARFPEGDRFNMAAVAGRRLWSSAALRAGTRLLAGSPGAGVRLASSTPVAVLQAAERVTHTGQVYDEDDYRKIRFIGRQKEVNENFAIDLVAEEPITEVTDRVVSCDGGGGARGHPKVYINLDKETKVGTCGYCGLRFKQKHHH